MDKKTDLWVPVYEGAPSQESLPSISRVFKLEPTSAQKIRTDTYRIEMDTKPSRSWSEIDAVRVLHGHPWSVKDHSLMSEGCHDAIFTTLLAARRLEDHGLAPYMPAEVWFSVFEFLDSADWAESIKKKKDKKDGSDSLVKKLIGLVLN